MSAANRGRVVHAGWLGIYGNCVILDHGMGLQSLYAHLSSIDVRVGEMIELDGKLGRSGATGLAGGDHLHGDVLRFLSKKNDVWFPKLKPVPAMGTEKENHTSWERYYRVSDCSSSSRNNWYLGR